MLPFKSRFVFPALVFGAALYALAGCQSSSSPTGSVGEVKASGSGASAGQFGAVLLVIDEESIDNGNPPNSFTDLEVNDHIAEVGLRGALPYFRDNVGETIDLFTGQVGDEGWHALKTIPVSWMETGPTENGARNYLAPGPGLGVGNPDDGKEVLLDKIPNVTPLRATGQAMLIGQTVLAVVYDGNVDVNYSPLTGNLMGANYGLVAFKVLDVRERRDASTGSLPRVTIQILDVDEVRSDELLLFDNAPEPKSSGEPYDVAPPDNPPTPEFVPAP